MSKLLNTRHEHFYSSLVHGLRISHPEPSTHGAFQGYKTARPRKRRTSSIGNFSHFFVSVKLRPCAMEHYTHLGNGPLKTSALQKEYYKNDEAMLASYRERDATQQALLDQQEPVAKTGKKKIKKRLK
ncbi:hypothetical protein MRX96_032350 [Rhipicephalus microplus]